MAPSLWSEVQRDLWASNIWSTTAHTVVPSRGCSPVLDAAAVVFRCASPCTLVCNIVTRLLLNRCAPLSLWLTHTHVYRCAWREKESSLLPLLPPEYPSTACWGDRNFPVFRRGGPVLTHGAEWEGSRPVPWTASCCCWSGLPRPAVITGEAGGQPERIQSEVMLPP